MSSARRWAWDQTAIAVAAAVGALVTGVVIGSAVHSGGTSTAASHAAAPTPTETTATTATAATSAAPSAVAVVAQPGTALALLRRLPVRARVAPPGYRVTAYGPAWADTDHNKCDSRDDVLSRDLSGASYTPGGCTVTGGALRDPYTGQTVQFGRNTVQVDHVVPLADAWQTGAAGWPAAKRLAFANDPLDLLSVAASTARAKGSADAASWLPPAAAYRLARAVARLPAGDPEALPVQLSFPPLAPGDAHVARAPALLPVISLAEHGAPGDPSISLDDLAVGCDGHRLYLASLSLGRRLEPTMLHALDLRAHTPPLARFLCEVGKAQCTIVEGFDWGAASHLPFLPRVRYRRSILSPARWRLDAEHLPIPALGRAAWNQALDGWRRRRRLPRYVCLSEADRRLTLDLEHRGHRTLLRAHLESAGCAVLSDAPEPGAYGWCEGHAHEIVVPLVSAQPAAWPAPPAVTAGGLVARDGGHLPGASRWLFAKLYCQPGRQPEILAEQLPALLTEWGVEPPRWWFLRYRDPDPHLRLRIALPDVDDFGPAARRVSVWVELLRRLALARDLQLAPYRPETGRWGNGRTMAAAEDVFGADSRAVVAQLQQPFPHPQALAAAHFVDIATGFTGTVTTAMTWLLEHARTAAACPVSREVSKDAVRLADPRRHWAALRAAPGGARVVETFAARERALRCYAGYVAADQHLDRDQVLMSLLHAHHLRAAGIDSDDERACLRLARAAALAWAARTGEATP